MRTNIIAGNWKMNSSQAEAVQLVNDVLNQVGDLSKTKVVFAPPFVYLAKVAETIKGRKNIHLSAQNMSDQDKGAFTGEISHAMLRDVGCEYVILGHSERRLYYGDTNAFVNRKVLKALENNLKPILCVGETLEEYEKGETLNVIRKQVTEGLGSVDSHKIENVVIAYEPVWAIGTGKTSTPENADKVHSEIRELVKKLYNGSVSEGMCILYGGSVNASNSADLLSREHIDGALVGGASLKANDFAAIIQSSEG